MTNDEFMEEVNKAVLPIIKRYAEVHGADMPETLPFVIGAFSGFAAGIGKGAGLDKNTTVALCVTGAMSGYDAP